jgi:hypothetical protein
MTRLYRLTGRKGNVRRLFAGVLLFIAIVETGSHVIMHSHLEPQSGSAALVGMPHDGHTSADCPFRHRSPGRDSNLKDETTGQAILSNGPKLSLSGTVFREMGILSSIANALSRPLNPPFHPPKHA